jgi:hypothetical protein
VTDYTKSTGNTGTMRIRDTDGKIEFWLKAGSSTYNYQLPWGYTVNGTTDNSNEFRFVTGGDWQKLKTWTVSTSQTVTFRLKDSGTNGLGGPTTLSASIKRATAPDAPAKPGYSSLASTSVNITFSDGDNNGASIDSRQIGYGTSSGTPTKTVSSDRSTAITGLTSGTKYYFKARTHNSEGWSPWSANLTLTMLDEPAAPGVVQLSAITQTTVHAVFADPTSTGGTAITDRQVGYSLTTGTPTNSVTYSGGVTITGLKPGTLYYFSSRTKNSVGWSVWSSPKTATTIAGAYVKVAGVWKKAVPYVKVAGVWKVARPWGRQFGYWEESE